MSTSRNGFFTLNYTVVPAETLLLPDYQPERRDGLWRSTCFELFVKGVDGGYREFNFAPLSAWNAYSFTDWRKGMRPLNVMAEPHLVDSRLDDRRTDFPRRYELDVVLGAELVERSAKASVTAVIEEKDGTKSYWALAHPPGAPDFHHPDCFVLELPPPTGT